MKNLKEKIWLLLLLLTPIVLWLLPSHIFDNTGIVLCPSKALFNLECLGCGMTRAVMHLHHFQLRQALSYNFGVVAVYPALVVLWFFWLKSIATNLGLIKPTPKGPFLNKK